MEHPLPVGTRASYADYSQRVNVVIVNNDNTSWAFRETLRRWDEKYSSRVGPTPSEHVDYIIAVEGELILLPVQRDGIKEPVPDAEHRLAVMREKL